MKVSKDMRSKIAIFLDIEGYRRELEGEIYEWLEEQGIDTQSDDFVDALAPRLSNSEFKSVNEFLEDLKKFKDGEDVGYG